MKHLIFMLAFITAAAWAQLPDGKDVPTAVPIVLGQTVEDAGSATVTANRVYKITLARGQKVTLTARFGQGVDNWSFYLMRPATRTIFTDFNQNAVAITYTRGNAALTQVSVDALDYIFSARNELFEKLQGRLA